MGPLSCAQFPNTALLVSVAEESPLLADRRGRGVRVAAEPAASTRLGALLPHSARRVRATGGGAGALAGAPGVLRVPGGGTAPQVERRPGPPAGFRRRGLSRRRDAR